MLGRWIFGLVLGIVGVMYLWLAWKATFDNPNSTDLAGNILGAVLFLVIGGVAGVAALSLLRQKRR